MVKGACALVTTSGLSVENFDMNLKERGNLSGENDSSTRDEGAATGTSLRFTQWPSFRFCRLETGVEASNTLTKAFGPETAFFKCCG
mmetsp:Transcript_14369/g.34421  ORF Transcript_14369/g.34421 Transcript_14369/m.34421 type:complete len:87 (-) Transcript_14369:1140-1400(-)